MQACATSLQVGGGTFLMTAPAAHVPPCAVESGAVTHGPALQPLKSTLVHMAPGATVAVPHGLPLHALLLYAVSITLEQVTPVGGAQEQVQVAAAALNPFWPR